MECKNCKKEVDDSFVFCPYCGHRTDGKKVCGKCGALIDEEFVYCPVCGTKTVSGEEAAPEKSVATPASKPAREGSDAVLEEKPAGEDEVLISIDEGASEKTANKYGAARSGKGVKARLDSAKAALSRVNFRLIDKIVLAVIATIFMICSFFGVVSYDATEMIDDMVSDNVKFDGDIKCEFTALDLADIGFFAMTLSYDKARKYVYDYDNDFYEEIKDIMYDNDYTDVTSARITINAKGCRKISRLLSDPELYKYAYADAVRQNADADEASAGVSWQALGVLSLVNMICAAVIFILAMVNLFKGVFKEGIWAVALMLISSLGLWAVTSGITSARGFDGLERNMGGAVASIVAFAVIFFVYRFARNVAESRKINVGQLVKGLTAVVTGAVILCTASMAVINTTLTYKEAENVRGVEFEYSFTSFETFDEYYFDVGKNNYVSDTVIEENFNADAALYSEDYYGVDPDMAMKSNFGIKAFTNTRFIGVTNKYAKPLIRLQPVLFLFAMYAAALMLSTGLVGLCGKEGKVRLKVLSIILFILAAGFGIAIPILLNAVFDASTKLTMIELSVGAAPIVMLVFAVIGAVCFGVANIFKNKEITFSKKSERSEI